nr:unnamed protein product [Digitaria exilis]
MIWAMAELIRKPRLLKKVQDEVRATTGRGCSRTTPQAQVPQDGAQGDAPATPSGAAAGAEGVTICGYDVPAKTRLFVNAWAIGRDPAIWGNNPEVFDPDRFDGSDTDFNGAHFELLPFGAGRRMCPGVAMGLATMELTLANMLYCFDWAMPEGMAPEDVNMEEAGGLTVHKKTPLLLVPTRYNTAGCSADEINLH